MKVVVSREALRRLADIEDRIAETNPEAAAKTGAQILARVRNLETLTARIGRKVPELDVDDIRELIEGNYRIIYRIRTDELLEIETIFDGRQERFPFGDLLDGE